MNPDAFHFAQDMENEGWEYLGISDSGDMMFSRTAYGQVFGANIYVDR